MLPALSVAGARVAHLAPFPLPAHRTGQAVFPQPALRRVSSSGHTGTFAPFARRPSRFRSLRTVVGVVRPWGQSPGTWLLPQRTRSQAPSLHRRYPASLVLRACPPPQTAGPVPRGRPVGSLFSHRWGFPCCVRSPAANMPSPLPRWDPRRDQVAPLEPGTAAFPILLLGRLPH